MTKQITPRLGSASILISIDDKHGIVVRHGTDNTVLAHKLPKDCTYHDWDDLFDFLEQIGVSRK